MAQNAQFFQEPMAKIPPHRQKAVSYQMAVAVRIQKLLNAKDWTNEELASTMSIRVQKVDEFLSGMYNFSISEIANLSTILGEDLITVTTTENDN